MALDGLPFDLPHPFRDVYVLDETGTIALDIDVAAVVNLDEQGTDLIITLPPGGGGGGGGGGSGDREIPGYAPRQRVLRSGRKVVRPE